MPYDSGLVSTCACKVSPVVTPSDTPYFVTVSFQNCGGSVGEVDMHSKEQLDEVKERIKYSQLCTSRRLVSIPFILGNARESLS
jgi:hypothetical protein